MPNIARRYIRIVNINKLRKLKLLINLKLKGKQRIICF